VTVGPADRLANAVCELPSKRHAAPPPAHAQNARHDAESRPNAARPRTGGMSGGNVALDARHDPIAGDLGRDPGKKPGRGMSRTDARQVPILGDTNGAATCTTPRTSPSTTPCTSQGMAGVAPVLPTDEGNTVTPAGNEMPAAAAFARVLRARSSSKFFACSPANAARRAAIP